ncbi:hypothetical protein [Phaeovulum sp.]|uniref:hypothetical protein n=1 Tax=Phaeovulum sp. TaxID=2934796 RepID=UPI003561B49B
MTNQTLALLYAALAALPTAMQIALAAGAPLGRFTVGGRFAGRLPPIWRVLALVQAGVLAVMALVVLERGGALSTGLPRGLFWPVVGLTVLTCVANAASPSRGERRLWAPVTLGMVAAALGTALF